MDKIQTEFEKFIEVQNNTNEGPIYDFMEKLSENKVIGFGFYGGYKVGMKAEREANLYILLKQIRHCMWHLRKQTKYLYGSKVIWETRLSLYRGIYNAIKARK